MIVAWTGHRPDLFRDASAARAAVDQVARELVATGSIDRFLVGGQRGVDTWAALGAHALDVPFTLVLPLEPDLFCQGWTSDDRRVLDETLGWAHDVQVIGGEPRAAYAERNRRLATSADLLIAVWTRTLGGGTAQTVAFARQRGTPLREVLLEPSAAAAAASGRGR